MTNIFISFSFRISKILHVNLFFISTLNVFLTHVKKDNFLQKKLKNVKINKKLNKKMN